MNSVVTSFRMRELMPLGRGGMGTTYLGCAKGAGGFERLIAIKRLHDHLQEDVEACTRLLAEAELAGCVHHANVVAVQHVDRDARGAFLVLDYIDGGSLKELMRAALPGTIPERIVLRLILDCLAGLEAIHSATDHRGELLHILHRDISPDNILVGLDGMARLTDFGIARSRRRPSLTAPSQLVGKMAFMAPEYVDRGELGPSLDVYSMGVTLWMLLAGKNPWAGLEEAQLLAILLTLGVPPIPEELGVGPRLCEVAEKACKRNAEERYQTALEMARAIEVLKAEHLIAERAEVAEYVQTNFTVKNSERRLKAAQLLQLRSDPPPPRPDADWTDTEKRLLPVVRASPLPPQLITNDRDTATATTTATVSLQLDELLDLPETTTVVDARIRVALPSPSAVDSPSPRVTNFGGIRFWMSVVLIAASGAFWWIKQSTLAEAIASSTVSQIEPTPGPLGSPLEQTTSGDRDVPELSRETIHTQLPKATDLAVQRPEIRPQAAVSGAQPSSPKAIRHRGLSGTIAPAPAPAPTPTSSERPTREQPPASEIISRNPYRDEGKPL